MFTYLSDNLYFSAEKDDEQIIKRVQVGLKRKENEKEKEALKSHLVTVTRSCWTGGKTCRLTQSLLSILFENT